MNTPLKGILVGLGSRGHNWYDTGKRHPETDWVAYVEAAEVNRARAMDKLDLHHRSELVRYALRHGLLDARE